MENKVELKWDKGNIIFNLNGTRTAKELIKVLPLEAKAQLWGEEVYFSVPLESELEQGREILEIGDIAYWPPGNAFCIFFGITPASTDNRPRAAGPVTVIGRLACIRDSEKLKKIKQGQKVSLKLKK